MELRLEADGNGPSARRSDSASDTGTSAAEPTRRCDTGSTMTSAR